MNERLTKTLTSTGLLVLLALFGKVAAQTTPATTPAPAVPTTPATTPAAPRNIPIQNYIAVGTLYYNQGKYDQAYVAFRAAVEMDPNNTSALLGLGRSQVKVRLFSAAIDTLKRLIALDSKNVSAYVALSQAYEQQYLSAGDTTSVKDNLAQALKVLNDAEALAQAQTGDTQKLSLSRVWNERGYVYRLQGDGGKAIDAFTKASELNPDSGVLLFNLGDMYYAVGDLPKAMEYLQQAVIADPRDAYSRAYYAKLLALSGDVTTAKSEAAQAVNLDQNNAYAVGQYGVVSYLAKEPAASKALLEKAIKIAPLSNAEFYYYLGRLSLDASDLKMARYHFTYAVSLSSRSPEYLYYLGLSYERGSGLIAPDRLKAKTNYEAALKLNPNYKPAQDGLARVK